MTRSPLAAIAIAVTGLLYPLSAQATFSCTVQGADQAAATLFAAPQADATAVMQVAGGAIVSIIDHPGQPVPPGWVAVAYDQQGTGNWGAGIRGWMRVDDLADCG